MDLGLLRLSRVLWQIRVLLFLLLIKICAADITYEAHLQSNKSVSPLERLRHDLFAHYDKYVRPAEHNKAINIELQLEITHVELESSTGIFTLYGRLRTEWKDSKLIWDKSEYDNLDMISVSDHDIWLPDLVLYNSILKNSADYYGSAQCYIKSTGEVNWIPFVRYQTLCEMDTHLWPFDSHLCTLILGSWTYSGWSIDLILNEENDTVLNLIMKNNEWEITHISTGRESKLYSCCAAPYISATYNLTLARRPASYKAIVCMPTFCVILMTLACFWLPPQRGEKIVLNGVNLVIVIMFVRYFAGQLPALSLSTPLIVTFYCYTLILIAFSTIISVVVLAISKSKHTRQAPLIIRSMMKGCLGKILGVANLKSRIDEAELKEPSPGVSKITEASSLTEEFYQGDWMSFACAIDRISFIIYCFIFSLFLISLYL